MKITHINTFDVEGGAARAVYRLHQGLLMIGENSRILSKYKTSQDNTVIQLIVDNVNDDTDLTNFRYLQTHYIDNNRTSLTNTLFSLCYPGFELAQLPIIQNSDVINLHWVAGQFQSPLTINNLLELGKPVIWTLHDMWAFTGGCHYSANCQGYEAECLNCPQLANNIYGLTSAILQDKLAFFNHPNLVIVTPSRWLADCAKKSRVFRHSRVEVIPNSLNTEVFNVMPKLSAKASLNIDPDEIVLLVGASSAKERRKGFYELIQVLKICQRDKRFAQLILHNKIRVCCFGETIDDFQELELMITPLGLIDSDEKLRLIYSAADIYILPSLEDNFPNTMLESMSCGTPVIGFNIGGIPDLVNDEVTGFISPENILQTMANKIIRLTFDSSLRQIMSNNCRQTILDNYTLEHQANIYLDLYRELLGYHNPPQSENHQSQEPNCKLSVCLNTNGLENFENTKFSLINYSLNQEIISLKQLNNQQQNDINELYNIIDNKDLHIEKTQIISNKTYADLTQTQSQLTQTQSQLTQTQSQLTQTQSQLTQTQAKFKESLKLIQAMKSSKFWLLRDKWFAIKKKLLS